MERPRDLPHPTRRPTPPQAVRPSNAPPVSRPAPEPTRSAESAAPAAPPSAASNPNAVPAWQGRLVSLLQRAKHYPDAARAAGEEGVAAVTFSMDRAGRVLAVRLARSSGSAALDAEAMALVRRAEPLPAPPPELPGQTITLTVPIRFSLQ